MANLRPGEFEAISAVRENYPMPEGHGQPLWLVERIAQDVATAYEAIASRVREDAWEEGYQAGYDAGAEVDD